MGEAEVNLKAGFVQDKAADHIFQEDSQRSVHFGETNILG